MANPRTVRSCSSAARAGRAAARNPCRPEFRVSIEAVYGDPDASEAIQGRLRKRFDPTLKLVHAGAAIPAALHALDVDGGIGVLTSYGEQGEEHITSFMKACGYEVHAFRHLISPITAQISHNGPGRVRTEISALAATGPEAIVQFGATLPAGAAAARAEVELKKYAQARFRIRRIDMLKEQFRDSDGGRVRVYPPRGGVIRFRANRHYHRPSASAPASAVSIARAGASC